MRHGDQSSRPGSCCSCRVAVVVFSLVLNVAVLVVVIIVVVVVVVEVSCSGCCRFCGCNCDCGCCGESQHGDMAGEVAGACILAEILDLLIEKR